MTNAQVSRVTCIKQDSIGFADTIMSAVSRRIDFFYLFIIFILLYMIYLLVRTKVTELYRTHDKDRFFLSFHRATLCVSAVFSVVWCPSVCLSVRLSVTLVT